VPRRGTQIAHHREGQNYHFYCWCCSRQGIIFVWEWFRVLWWIQSYIRKTLSWRKDKVRVVNTHLIIAGAWWGTRMR
jgi:hypothetical protein